MSGETHPSFSRPPVQSGNDSLNIELPGARSPRISLRQWRVLHAVVDCGGFAQASEFLHLSQSAISYALAKLQEQLGVPLLKIEGRKAHLTEIGRAVLERSRRLIRDANEIEAFASAMERGWEPEIRLVVDSAFPSNLLMRALSIFARTGKGTPVLLSEVTNVGMEEALRQCSTDLAISAQVPKVGGGQTR